MKNETQKKWKLIAAGECAIRNGIGEIFAILSAICNQVLRREAGVG
jgi:hypothetical protein